MSFFTDVVSFIRYRKEREKLELETEKLKEELNNRNSIREKLKLEIEKLKEELYNRDFLIEKAGIKDIEKYDNNTKKLIKKIEHLSNKDAGVSRQKGEEGDTNLLAFRKLKTDRDWLKGHLGYYIAVIDGKLIDMDKNRRQLLKRIRSGFSKKRRFVKLVEEDKDIVEEDKDIIDLSNSVDVMNDL